MRGKEGNRTQAEAGEARISVSGWVGVSGMETLGGRFTGQLPGHASGSACDCDL